MMWAKTNRARGSLSPFGGRLAYVGLLGGIYLSLWGGAGVAEAQGSRRSKKPAVTGADQAPLSQKAPQTPAQQPIPTKEPPPAPRRTAPVAVLRMPIQGNTGEVETLFRETLYEALRSTGLTVVPEEEVKTKLDRAPELLACLTRSCFARMALALGSGVQWGVEGEIQRPARSTYTMRLQIRDLSTGQFAGTPVEERCEICGTEEARQMVAAAAKRLGQQVPESSAERIQATGILELASDPQGAEVVIDGKLQTDKTPAAYLLGLGVHSLELSAKGYKSVRRPVEVYSGQKVALTIELPLIPPNRPWLKALSALSIIGATGAIVAGGVMLHYHGKPAYSTDPLAPANAPLCLPPQPHCPEKYDNAALGGVLLSAGGVLAVGAALSIYFDYNPPRKRRP